MGNSVVDPQELRWRIREVLVPGAEPVGESGRRNDVRRVAGGLEEAESFFEELEELGEIIVAVAYPGTLVRLGNEGNVGLRPTSKSGEPTIDVGLECVPEIRKIKFVHDMER